MARTARPGSRRGPCFCLVVLCIPGRMPRVTPGFDLRDELRRELRRHPRVVYQKLFENGEQRDRLVTSLPTFLPFRGPGYAAVMWVMDWDHRLPSRELILRLYAYYSRRGAGHGAAGAGRTPRDDRARGSVPRIRRARLRRPAGRRGLRVRGHARGRGEEVPSGQRVAPRGRTRASVAAPRTWCARPTPTRSCPARCARGRPGLGDLEAAEWAAPSESGHHRWGIDVWYLRNFNGMVGEGTAFLVDLDDAVVISQRDFQFRAG